MDRQPLARHELRRGYYYGTAAGGADSIAYWTGEHFVQVMHGFGDTYLSVAHYGPGFMPYAPVPPSPTFTSELRWADRY